MFHNLSLLSCLQRLFRFCRPAIRPCLRKPRRRLKSSTCFPIAVTETLEDRQLLAADDLTELNDDFEDAATLTNWQRIYQTEGWHRESVDFPRASPCCIRNNGKKPIWFSVR